jgi:O-antigen ligase
MATDWFLAHGHKAFGLGFGTTQTLLPLEQIETHHMHGQAFLWLHNDWLQLAIEGGLIGTACVGLAVGRLARVSYHKPVLAAMLAGFAVLMLFNYPLEMPFHSLVLVLVCGMAEAATCLRASPVTSHSLRFRAVQKKNS